MGIGILGSLGNCGVTMDGVLWQLHGDLKSHLRGKFPDLDFFVDRWPDPEAVAARVDPTGVQVRVR